MLSVGRYSLPRMKADLLGQLIMIGVPGKELDEKTARLFRKVKPGAFILFGRNIESAPQLRKLIDDLRDLSEIEPIITVDQEGGRVSRLRLIGSEPPNAQQLRDKNDIEVIAREKGAQRDIVRNIISAALHPHLSSRDMVSAHTLLLHLAVFDPAVSAQDNFSDRIGEIRTRPDITLDELSVASICRQSAIAVVRRKRGSSSVGRALAFQA